MEGAPPPKLITLFKLSTEVTQFTLLALLSMLTVAPLFSLFILHQAFISCGILVSGIRARGVSSEHMENMEMFFCSPT